ncbi:peroxiredoxin family protein [Ilyomonas limi]|nr:thioredoxin domain-containing protein [Ilyomonas limi]
MYKYLLSALFCVVLCSMAFAQQTKTTKTTIAPFKIRLVNGEGFTYSQLAKNKPTILVYFSPTCDHCKKFTEAMLKRKKELADRQIIMISYLPLNEVKQFDDEFHLSSYPNIKVGSEGYTFIVQKYYNIQQFPFVATYDKQGKLSKIVPYNKESAQMAAQL